MNPFGTRSRAEEFARLLDGTFAGAVSAPMASYALTAGRLRTAGVALAPSAAPRPEFRAALRTRLVAVASVQAHNVAEAAAPAKARGLEGVTAWSQTRRAQRGMGIAAGAMASVVAVAGVAVAGSQSLPGDPFYSVKKGAEALELRTAGGDVAKGSKHLDFAAERLSEVRGLTLGRDAALGPIAPGTAGALGGSVSDRVRDTLAAMDAETRKGTDLLTAAYRDDHDDAPLEILSTFADRQSDDLRELLPELPSGARDRAEDSLALVSGVAVEASQLLAVGVCTQNCNPTSPSPAIDPGTGQPVPNPAPSASASAPCGCDPVAATPSPTSAPSPEPTTQSSQPSPAPSRTPAPSPSPASPAPLPLPVPLPSPSPVPLPSLPIPLPSLSPTPLPLPLPSLPSLPLPKPTDLLGG
jgi:hypothetical protein